jgi:hypothetical protein
MNLGELTLRDGPLRALPAKPSYDGPRGLGSSCVRER